MYARVLGALFLIPFVMACSSGGSGTAGEDEHLTAAAGPAEVTFSHDHRPVDGNLKELKLVKNASGTYDATLRTAFFDRLEGREVDRTDALANGLSCSFLTSQVKCSRDDRPVDGVLKELEVQENDHTSASERWDASVRTAFFDRLKGTLVDDTVSVATRLERR